MSVAPEKKMKIKMSVAPEEKTKIKMSVAPEDGEGKQTRARTDSVESLESLEDPFDVNYDPTEGKDSYGGRTALGTDPAEEVLGFKARGRRFCEDPHSSKIATWFHLMYATVIIASCVAFCTETLNFKGQPQGRNLSVANYELLEALFTGIFTADILIRAALAARVCCCCKGTKGGGAKEGDGSLAPVPFFLDIMVIFDILSVLPLPIGAIITATGLGTEFPWLGSSVRVLSICRILRIFKVTRNFEGAKVLFVTMKNSIRPLTVSFIAHRRHEYRFGGALLCRAVLRRGLRVYGPDECGVLSRDHADHDRVWRPDSGLAGRQICRRRDRVPWLFLYGHAPSHYWFQV
jgi:hypothetical protein